MGLLRELKKNFPLFMMALPALLCLLIFSYMPMFGVILAFKNYNFDDGFLRSPWTGLKNFEFLFTETTIEMTRNTIVYNVIFIIIGLISATAVAIILNEVKNRFLARVHQTILIMPFFLSWVVIAFVTYAFIKPDDTGFINSMLVGMGKESVMWYSEIKYWPALLIFLNTWKYLGYNSVVYLAAITGISQEFYESAVIDGATKLQQSIYITIPCIKPMLIILTILAVGRIFYADFGLFFQVPQNQGQLYPVTQVIDTYVYTSLTGSFNVGMAAAAGLYQSIVGFILVVLSNKIVKKVDSEYALF